MRNLVLRPVDVLRALSVVLLLASCTSSKPGSSGSVTIKFPSKTELQSRPSSLAIKIAPSTSGSSWGLSDPTSLGDLNCFAILYQGTEPENSHDTCTDSTGKVITSPGAWFGGYQPGDSATISVPAGAKRTLSVLGFKSASAAACATIRTHLDTTQFSAPYLIGSTTQDLLSQESDVTIDISFSSPTKLVNCSGPDFDGVITVPSITATKLVFTTQPGTAAAGSPWTVGPVVKAEDASGNVDTSFTGNVSIAFDVNPNSGVLSGTQTVAAVAGVATFNALSINKSGSGYTLAASAGSLTGGLSNPFTINPGTAAQLVYKIQPSNLTAGNSFSLNPKIQIEDSFGNVISSSADSVLAVSLSISTGGSLYGPTSVAAVNGVAEFSGLTIPTAGSFQLTASATTAGGASLNVTSTPFTVALPATKLVFLSSPVSTQQGTNLPNFVVAAEDATGAVVAGYNQVIQVGLSDNPNNAGYLSGPSTQSPSGGQATFSSLSIATAATGYRLVATSGSLTSAISDYFAIQAHPTLLTTNLTIPVGGVFIDVFTGGAGLYNFSAGSGSVASNAVYKAPLTPGGDTIYGFAPTATFGVTSVTVAPGTIYSTGVGLIAAGPYHNCLIASGGAMKCWGVNFALGDFQASPHQFGAIGFTSVTAGYQHTCGILNTGDVKCFGMNTNGQFANGAVSASIVGGDAPIAYDSGHAYTRISAGQKYTCGIRTADSKIYCAGANATGQLGNGTTVDSTTAVLSDATNTYASVSSGLGHTCGVTTSGALYCWGDNTFGQLGDGTTTQQLTPHLNPSGLVFQSVSAGSQHTCGITTAGVLYCWGGNASGQLGTATTTTQTTPVVIDGGSPYSIVAAGDRATCGITTGGYLRCWGDNSAHQVGNSSSTNQLTPMTINSGVLYANVVAGAKHFCGVTMAGLVKCWGDHSYDAIGSGLNVVQSLPLLVNTGVAGSFSKMVAGNEQTCGIRNDGVVYCWGNNTAGSLGNGSMDWSVQPSSPVDSGQGYSKVTLGSSHGCGITGGVLKCWGGNSFGQVGNGNQTNQTSPMVIDGGASYIDVSAGDFHTCGITASHQLKCWGANNNSQLGNGSSVASLAPIVINGGSPYQQVALGGSHSCALTMAGEIQCWGENTYGAVGNGSTATQAYPITIGAGFSAVVSGGEHSCGLRIDGSVVCWGWSVGLGNIGQMNSPFPVDTGSTYVSISAGYDGVCGITPGHALKCFGGNLGGEVGIGTTTSIPATVAAYVDPGAEYQSVSVGNEYTCAVTTNSVSKCWGRSVSGRLGLGIPLDYQPVPSAPLL